MITLSLVVFLIANMLSHSKSTKLDATHMTRVAIVVLVIASALSVQSLYPSGWVIYPVDIMKNVPIFSSTLEIGSLSTLIELVIYLASAGCLIAASNNDYPREISLVVLFSVLGASLLICATDILSLYLCIELQSFGLYTLAALYYFSKTQGASTTGAGLKYFLLGALASSTILLGIAIIYAYTGTTSLHNLYIIITMTGPTDYSLLFGFAFVFVGLLFKLSAAPFHSWAPDVYDDTPTVITIFLIVVPKIAYITVVATLVHLCTLISHSILEILQISGVLSLIIGAVVGVTQSRMKRMLTYSTITHVGFILLAVSSLSVESDTALLFYIIQYSVTNLATFMVLILIGFVVIDNKDITFISSLKGLASNQPIIAFTLTVLLLSAAGVPPAAGFFAKYSVLYAIILSEKYSLALFAVLASVVSAVYYLGTIATIYFNSPTKLQYCENTINSVDSTKMTSSYIIAALTLFVISFSLFPNLIFNCTMVMALNFY